MVSNVNYQRIWHTVLCIPSGKVVSYGQIADFAGLPGKARLVGKALANVPKEGWQGREVPWFRVINSQGKLSFPAGSERFEKQKKKLMDEKVTVIGAKIKLADFKWQPDLAELLFKLTY